MFVFKGSKGDSTVWVETKEIDGYWLSFNPKRLYCIESEFKAHLVLSELVKQEPEMRFEIIPVNYPV